MDQWRVEEDRPARSTTSLVSEQPLLFFLGVGAAPLDRLGKTMHRLVFKR